MIEVMIGVFDNFIFYLYIFKAETKFILIDAYNHKNIDME
jgi:hypothetical protein